MSVSRWMMLVAVSVVLAGFVSSVVVAADPDEESPTVKYGFISLWTNEPNVGKAGVDESTRHNDKSALKIEFKGEKDWSLEAEEPFDVKEGDVIEMSVWMKIDGKGLSSLSGATMDGDQSVIEWKEGEEVLKGTNDWTQLKTQVKAGKGVKIVRPRIIGEGAATVWIAEFTAAKVK